MMHPDGDLDGTTTDDGLSTLEDRIDAVAEVPEISKRKPETWDEEDEYHAYNRPDDPPASEHAHRKFAAQVEGERVSWSSDDENDGDDDDGMNDGEAVYNKFKNRKAVQRKAVAASTRRARAAVAGKDSGVGKNPRKAKGTAEKNTKTRDVYGDESEDDLMEHTLPDYLKERRSRFDKRIGKLRAAGLRLPPDYSEVDFSDDERLEELKEKPDFNTKPARDYKDITLPYSLGLIPSAIAQWLRDYQVDGVAFLHELFVYQKGGILGDDMGLGKTVQVIAFLTAAYGKTGDGRDAKRMRKMRRRGDGVWYPRTLVICPGTLIQNWKSEFNRWGWWHVDAYHGPSKEASLQAAISGRLEVLITTYTTYRMNRNAINMIEWDCVVADECHVIKERKSEVTQAMNEINALCRIGLTGTAIQNKYEELWTLLNWTNPGRFGPISTWKASICEPLRVGQSHDCTITQLSKARKTAKKLVENLLPEFFLRRMKSLIADQLPKKTDRVVFCPMTPTQSEAYQNFLDSDVVNRIKYSTESCKCGSGKKSGWCCFALLPDGTKWQAHVFPAIQTLQKVANHLAVLIPQGADPKDKAGKDLETLKIVMPDRWRELWRNRDSIMNYANPEFCGKWKVLKKLLYLWKRNGEKVLIFSHSVRLLKMLKMLLTATSFNVSYLDGSMNYEDRSRAVDDFNSDPLQFIFLISTRAGGIGITLTAASRCLIMDPNWNPSYDLQAQDRCYRIGQTRDVEVFRLVSAGTIEEIVYARQIYKQQQANTAYEASAERRYFKGVQEKKDQKGEIFGLRNLFEYQSNGTVLRDIINKTNIAESRAGISVVGLDLDRSDDSDDEEGSSSQNDPLAALKLDLDDDEESAMSQLAALVRGDEDESSQKTCKRKRASSSFSNADAAKKGKKQHDPIQAILAGAGVQYTHENSEVIGSSKVETRLSRRAEEAGNDFTLREAPVFLPSESQLPTAGNIINNPASGETTIKFKYHPPPDVMRRQFCSMATRYGFSSTTEFALVVEGMTQRQRRAVLDRWYRERREIAANMLNEDLS